ncbi:peptidylprolyl isomerase [Falsibacillus albus]|uniref:Foldase protein PrsA n=1 Tax=Falsibacillus albus TaxID=2478915 RepID=A0A3L7K5F5_9BACI|nr:peptidylprolyl isomerase [Falsibacillus albus]RLQ97301.1 peptidylprolyl isomerase [Falsibacillus albus]
MKKWILSLSLAAGVIGLAGCSGNGGGSDVVAKTDAGNITKDQLYEAMKDKYGEQALQQLVFEKVLSDKYKVTDKEVDQKINKIKDQLGPNFEQALQQYGYKNEKDLRETLKIGLLQEKAATKDVKVTDKELKKAYDDYQPEIKASHILVDDEKTANEIETKLKNGEKFADLAKKYSKDTGSAKNGGDLGWFGQGKMDPTFEKAAYALKVGEVSKPVKTQYGYHIIKLTDKKKKKSFDDMKKELTEQVKASKVDQTKIQEAMKNEIKKADLKVEDKDLKSTFDQLLNSQPSSGASADGSNGSATGADSSSNQSSDQSSDQK